MDERCRFFLSNRWGIILYEDNWESAAKKKLSEAIVNRLR